MQIPVELKPCPFCGAPLRMIQNYYPSDPGLAGWVHDGDDCILSAVDFSVPHTSKYVTMWNRRSTIVIDHIN